MPYRVFGVSKDRVKLSGFYVFLGGLTVKAVFGA